MNINASVDFPSGAKLVLIENFFPTELANDINALFKTPRDQWSENPAFAHCPGRLDYNRQHPTRDAVKSYAVQIQKTIGQSINTEVEYIDHSLWLDLPGYRIEPHKDVKGFPEIAVQIYMGDPELVWEMLGFCIYTENRQALFESHYRTNAGYILLHPHEILHGLNHHIPPQFVRNSVYIRYRAK
jgi:hypothetical protein